MPSASIKKVCLWLKKPRLLVVGIVSFLTEYDTLNQVIRSECSGGTSAALDAVQDRIQESIQSESSGGKKSSEVVRKQNTERCGKRCGKPSF